MIMLISLSVLLSAVHCVNIRPVGKDVLLVGSSHVFRRLVDVIVTDLHYCHNVRGDGWNQTRDLFNTKVVHANNDIEALPVVARR
jgi:N12 class adenine-specific DNA methylase